MSNSETDKLQEISDSIEKINAIIEAKLQKAIEEHPISSDYISQLKSHTASFIEAEKNLFHKAKTPIEKDEVKKDLNLIIELLEDTSEINVERCYARAKETRHQPSPLLLGIGIACAVAGLVFLAATIAFFIPLFFIIPPVAYVFMGLSIYSASVAGFFSGVAFGIIGLPTQHSISMSNLTTALKSPADLRPSTISIFKPMNIQSELEEKRLSQLMVEN